NPSRTGSSPLMVLKRVVLPEPLAPRITVSSPGLAVMLTPWRTSVASYPEVTLLRVSISSPRSSLIRDRHESLRDSIESLLEFRARASVRGRVRGLCLRDPCSWTFCVRREGRTRPAAAASESGWQSLPSLLRVCRRQVRRAAAVLVLWPKPLRPRFVSALPVEHWTPDRGDT